MQRALLICPSFFHGRADGISRVSALWSEALKSLSGTLPFVWAANDKSDGVPSAEGRGFGHAYASMLFSARWGRSLAATLGSGASNADSLPPLIVCTHAGLSPVARILGARYRRPYLVFLHGVEVWRPLSRRTRWGLRAASVLCGNSDATLREFKANNSWATAQAMQVTHLGSATEPLTAPRGMSDRPAHNPLRVLMVGRMASGDSSGPYRTAESLYKGFTSAIDAVMALKQRGVEVILEIVGDGDARTDVEAYTRRQGGAAPVVFHGAVNDAALAQHYSNADVFLLPSEREGFGLVYVEAMAHGLPCIAADTGASREVIIDDESGYLVRARDGQMIADRLFVVARNQEVYRRLRSGARRRYDEHFTAQRCRDRFIQVLEHVQTSRSRVGPRDHSRI